MTVKTLTVSGLNVAAQVLGGTGLTSSTTNGVTTLSVSGTQASGTRFLNPTAGSYSELYVDSDDRRITLGQRSSTQSGGDLAYLYTATATPISFWTGAAERMRITASGNVGIGTTSPGQLLDISGAAASNRLIQFSASGAAKAYLGLGTDNVLRVETASTDDIRIRINTADLVTFKSGGAVGIGTTSPLSTLHVVKAAGATLRVTTETGAGGGNSSILMGNQDSLGANKPFILRSINAGLYLGTGDSWSSETGGTLTTRMIIDSSGNVGIGTITPSATLHVVAPNTSDIEARFTGGNTQGIAIQNGTLWEYRVAADTGEIAFNYTGYNTGTTYFRNTHIYNGKYGTLAFFQGSTGRLGIGTTTPSEKLHINGNVLLENNNGYYIKNNAGTSCRVGAVDSVNQLIFGDGVTTSMYFTAGQNIYFNANGAYRGNINGTTGYWRIGDSNAASVPMDVFANVTQTANVLRLTAQSGYFTFANGTFSAVNTSTKTIVLTIDSAETTTAAQINAGVIGAAIHGTGAGFGSFTVFSAAFTVTSATTISSKLVITCTWTGTPATNPSNAAVTAIIINGFRPGWGPQLLFAGMGDGRDTGAIRVLTETDNSGANAYMAFCTRGLETVPERMRLTSTGSLGIGTTDPKATLHANGTFAITTATSGTANSVILAAANYALPDATTCSGRMYWVKNTSASAITMTSAGGTIDGVAAGTGVSLAQYDCYTVISNGTNWFII